MTSKEKLTALRKVMAKNAIEAFIIYSADPHMSEYLPLEWKEREWISGFTGSAGFVVVTSNKAGLWTDGRYFTQATEQLKGTGITMYKEKVVDAIDYIDWLIEETSEEAKIAVNPVVTSHAHWVSLAEKLEKNNRKLMGKDFLKEVWTDRGEPLHNPIFHHPLELSGESASSKIAAIRKEIQKEKATAHIISSLDDVTWTLNLRGSDVEYNPVFLGYIYLTLEEVFLFVNIDQLTDDAKEAMNDAGVQLRPYEQFFDFLKAVSDQRIWIAFNCNQAVFKQLRPVNTFVIQPAPGNLMKALKNKTELEGFRTVMVRDGVAMVKFLYWLTHEVGKTPMTEYSIGQKLHEFRAEGENFFGESFNSIVSFKENGAIIHYAAPAENSAAVTADGSILIDSGGQYLEGTSDITRTLALGPVTEEFKHDYTLVLKTHIALARVKFPKGTRGAQIDAFARIYLWEEGKDYNHGTGHGVGSFLNVHEGPQSIRKEYNPTTLQLGMVMSNEPGYYIENNYGIRHENLMVIKEFKETEWNAFYEFEILTLCPIFKEPIQQELLTKEEIKWLNDYHRLCKEKLAPHLEGEVKAWFLELVTEL